MKWFFAINDKSPWFADYSQMIKVAVHTALTKTTLQPYCLHDGDDADLTQWLNGNGVKIIKRESYFKQMLKQEADKNGIPDILHICAGAFLRIEIPRIPNIFDAGENILYTDCDVMFALDPVPYLSKLDVKYLAAGPEFNAQDYRFMNSGVMVMNVDSLSKEHDGFMEYIKKRLSVFVLHSGDEPAYNEYYQNRWTHLCPEMNWKPYWGKNSSATIIHFHGPKPMRGHIYAKEAPGNLIASLAKNGYHEYSRDWNDLLRKILA